MLRRISRLNKLYLNLNLNEIKFYEYKREEEPEFQVAWSNTRKKSIFLDSNDFPSNPSYAAFILAHELAHIWLEHPRKKSAEEEFQASLCARFVLATKIGPKKARLLMQRWTKEWLDLIAE
jgi:Zn-dependent peptidase ImmA (M78 family)